MISEASGFSRGTVDRALNNRPGINEKTRKKILKIAKEMGYRPNFIGQALVTGKTKTIGIILFGLKNTYFSEIYTAIENTARESGYLPLLSLSHKRIEIEKDSINYFLDRQVDGLIIVPVNKNPDFYHHIQLPIVTIGNKIDDSIPFVGIRDGQAVEEYVDLMVAKGYEEVIFFCPPLRHRDMANIYAMEERYRGYLKAMNKYEGRIIVKVVIDRWEIFNLIEQQRRKHIKTAVLCSSDSFALDILNFINDNNIKPDTIGIAGFDHLSVLKYIRPKLSSVDYSKNLVGQKAFLLLKEMIEKEIPGNNIYIDHEILEGETI